MYKLLIKKITYYFIHYVSSKSYALKVITHYFYIITNEVTRFFR